MPRALQPGQRAPAHPDDPHSVMVAEQHEGYYLIGPWDGRHQRLAAHARAVRVEGVFVDVSDDLHDDQQAEYEREAAEARQRVAAAATREDAAYEAHRDRMMNDLNYRSHYESGGLNRRDEQ